jgi:prevent-host-death family protein
MHAWQVQDAKARFSELLRSATNDDPQAITVRGRTTAVVLSQDEYERLKGKKVRWEPATKPQTCPNTGDSLNQLAIAQRVRQAVRRNILRPI